MTYDEQLAAARAAVDAAKKAQQSHNAIVRSEKEAALQAVTAKHAVEIALRSADLREAERALRAVQEAAPPHPWVGKKVVRTERKNSTSWRGGYTEIEVFGIVEMMTTETLLPGNISSWQMPVLGHPLVRTLKADGKPGLKFYTNMAGWKLVEE